MPQLELTVVDVPSQRRETFLFARSPVRVGRSTLNELVIDHEFVSGIHGVFRFGAEGVSFVDMGSRNGSQVNGEPLKSHHPVQLSPGAEIGVGHLVLIARALPDPAPVHDDDDPPEAPPGRYAFGAAGAPADGPDKPAPARAETTALPFGFDIRKLAPAPALSVTEPPSVPAYVPPRAPDEYVVPPALVGFTKALTPLRSSGSARPGAPASAVLARLREIAAVQAEPKDREITLGTAALLELLVGKLVALRDSVELSGRELGVRPFADRTPLYVERDPQRLLDYLLDGDRAAARREDVARLFTDLFTHEVAFLAALRDGVDALLERLHPDAAGLEPGLFGGGPLRRFRAHYDEEAERAWDTILGNVFGETYAELMSASARAASAKGDDVRVEPAPAPPRRPTLTIVSGPVNASAFSWHTNDAVLGRAADCEIVVDHPSVSRRHARFAVAGGVWTVFDLDSANGILVNGEKFKTAELETGDIVQIGSVQLRFES